MNRWKAISSRIRELFLDGTWIANTNFRHQIANVSWEQAIEKFESLNTVAALTYHINYYVAGVLKVLQGGDLDIHDKYSFDLPPMTNETQWNSLKESLFSNASQFADCVEQLNDESLDAGFVKPQYGTYERNIEAIIEHGYYHLGQISLILKLINSKNKQQPATS